MTDIPIILVAHDDGSYSFADTGERIVMERVSLHEITEHLEDRHTRLHPPPSPDEIWDEYHRGAEPPIDIILDRPTFLTLAPDRKTGSITLRKTTSGEVLAADVTAQQVFTALQRDHDER